MPDVMLGILELSRLLAGRGGCGRVGHPRLPTLSHRTARRRTDRSAAGALFPDGAVDLDAFTVELDRGTRVVVLANPHNPTAGHLASTSAQIAEMCAERCAFVIADEIHGPLVLPGANYALAGGLRRRARLRGGVDVGIQSVQPGRAQSRPSGHRVGWHPRGGQPALLPLGEHAGLLGVIAGEVAFTSGDTWLDGVLAQLDANRATAATASGGRAARSGMDPAAGHLHGLPIAVGCSWVTIRPRRCCAAGASS